MISDNANWDYRTLQMFNPRYFSQILNSDQLSASDWSCYFDFQPAVFGSLELDVLPASWYPNGALNIIMIPRTHVNAMADYRGNPPAVGTSSGSFRLMQMVRWESSAGGQYVVPAYGTNPPQTILAGEQNNYHPSPWGNSADDEIYFVPQGTIFAPPAGPGSITPLAPPQNYWLFIAESNSGEFYYMTIPYNGNNYWGKCVGIYVENQSLPSQTANPLYWLVIGADGSWHVHSSGGVGNYANDVFFTWPLYAADPGTFPPYGALQAECSCLQFFGKKVSIRSNTSMDSVNWYTTAP